MTHELITEWRLKQISISEENYFILKSYGKAGESFNDVISAILKKLETQQDDRSGELRDQSVVCKPITRDGYGHGYIITTNKKVCACKDCTNIGTTVLQVKYIQKVGYFCGTCTKDLLDQGLAIKAGEINN